VVAAVQKPQSVAESLPDAFWCLPLQELLERLGSAPEGLSSAEAANRLRRYGPNLIGPEPRYARLRAFFHLLGSPLVAVLLVAATVSIALGDPAGGSIIIAIVALSVGINFRVEYRAHKAVQEIQRQIPATVSVLRDGREKMLPVAELVPGDVIRLAAGDLVPADARLLEAKDLHIREAALTGESLPVDKAATELPPGPHGLSEAINSVFLGTSVETGSALAIVVRTGARTALGEIAARLASRPPETEFGRGIRHFGWMITRVILLLVLFVLLVNLLLHRPVLESFLFSVALAVGMTPEMMPMIITVTLAQGARRMARNKVLVKELPAIEDFGSVDILCTDKTGTLTEGDVALHQCVDIFGQASPDVLRLAYLNSYYQTGVRSPLDAAILKHEQPDVPEYAKQDEIPFDFTRKRISVILRRAGELILVTKGEAESMLTICTRVAVNGALQSFDEALRAAAAETFRTLSRQGYRTLAVALRTVEKRESYGPDQERDMTLAGFATFLDPPKPGVAADLAALRRSGIAVVILTGDNPYVAAKVAADVGLPAERVFTGEQVDAMEDAALAWQAEHGALFARMSPQQKNRVILALKARGHVVGYLGDGINDAPSLHAADVGISVAGGVPVAKEAANIILLEKDLAVLSQGVLEGRRCFANITKYVLMSTSSNFGNMFSMAAAALLLPFLPMLPTQILLNNFLYDVAQLGLPGDRVDATLLAKPKRWRIAFIRQFMTLMGPVSSLYDFLTFAVLLGLFHGWANPTLFRTGWFVESLATQTLVVLVLRTAARPWRSRPSGPLALGVAGVALLGTLLPYTPAARWLGFTPLPLPLLAAIAVLTLTYLALLEAAKARFFRRHGLA
jgi:Mg2+-importing ATPase